MLYIAGAALDCAIIALEIPGIVLNSNDSAVRTIAFAVNSEVSECQFA